MDGSLGLSEMFWVVRLPGSQRLKVLETFGTHTHVYIYICKYVYMIIYV